MPGRWRRRMVAIARLVLRSRQALAVIRCYGETLALETMFYPDEIRSLKEMPSWNSQIEMVRGDQDGPRTGRPADHYL